MCAYGVDDLDLLNHRVNIHGIRPFPQRVIAIRKFPQLTTTSKLREFLGFVNFYRRFLPQSANIPQPPPDLLRGKPSKNTALTWTPSANAVFSTINEELPKAYC